MEAEEVTAGGHHLVTEAGRSSGRGARRSKRSEDGGACLFQWKRTSTLDPMFELTHRPPFPPLFLAAPRRSPATPVTRD